MTEQLFDARSALEAKREAMTRVHANAEEAWKVAAKLSVEAVAKRKPEFTTDAVWWWLEHHYPDYMPHEPRAMGPIMRWAVTTGVVAATDRTTRSTRVACHARPVAIWRSLIVSSDA